MQADEFTVRRWDFHQCNDFEGWTVPEHFAPIVCGGSIQFAPRFRANPGLPPYQDRGMPWALFPHMSGVIDPLLSPSGLNIPASRARKVRLRVLNLSTETDGEIRWTTREIPGKEFGPAHFAMEPYGRDWQEIVCHLDDISWEGTLDQLRIKCGLKAVRGTIFIDAIAVTAEPARPRAPQPDIRGAQGVPQIECPDLPQAHIDEAFAVLNDSVVSFGEPLRGFPAAFFSPGADGACYGRSWWLLDASLAMLPVIWTNPGFCAEMLRGFIAVQDENPDGHIDHEGGMVGRGAPGDLSVIPRYFEAIEAMARVTRDETLLDEMYRSADRYLDWWFSPVKRDPTTGVIWGYHEESFTDAYGFLPGEMAPVDLNVAVAHGALVAADLARRLGRTAAAARHRQQFAELKTAINRTLWNETHGAYLNFNLKTGQHEILLASHMFDPLRLGIAPPERAERLLQRLLDPVEFGWGGLGLTTLSRKDPKFVVIKTPGFDFSAWDGDIWTMRNLPVIFGLRDNGRHDLAAELTWQTIRVVNGKFAEFFDPEEGRGWGVQRYAWTAGQYLQAVIECLFGITWQAETRTLHITPLIPAALQDRTLSLRNLRLPYENCRVDVTIAPQAVTVAAVPPFAEASVAVTMPGKPTRRSALGGSIHLQLPTA